MARTGEDWKEIAYILRDKAHYSEEGIERVKALISGMNKNRSFALALGASSHGEDKYLFSYNNWIKEKENKLEPNWIQGFIMGEGCFYTYLSKPSDLRVSKNKSSIEKILEDSKVISYGEDGFSYENILCNSSLEIGQNNHDIFLLVKLQEFFEAGYLKPKYEFNNKEEILSVLHSTVRANKLYRFILRDKNKIIKFIEDFPMLNSKQLDYSDWKKITIYKSENKHKTREGYFLIKEILNNINTKRRY